MNKTVTVADLDTRLALQSNVPTRGPGGAVVPGWVTFATVWGRVDEQSGRETLRAGQIQAERVVIVTMWKRDGLRARMRATFAGRTLDIKAVIPAKDNPAFQELHCVEVVSG